MFGKIFSMEIKGKFKSLSVLILIVSIFLFHYTQFIGDLKRDGVKPIPLRFEYSNSNTSAIKGVTLEDNIEYTYNTMKADYESGDTLRIKGINMFYEKINEGQREFLEETIEEMESIKIQTIDEYYVFIEKVDKALGGNTVYSNENNFSSVLNSKYYDSNMELYTRILKEDKVTNAYGRLFADYIGIAISFFTVFITAFTLIKDRRYNTNELIYTTRVSSYKYILGKYLADILVATCIVFLVAGHGTWMFHNFSKLTDDPISYIAFFKYSILWIIPTIMFVTSLSYVLQLIFSNGIIPIIVQFFYWIYSIGPTVSEGVQVTKYFIRFNKIVPHSEFQPYIKDIYLNRILFTILSLGLLVLAIKLWDKKRGDLDSGFKLGKKDTLQ
jgi:ABC-type Na+ efflux pump permease subunit